MREVAETGEGNCEEVEFEGLAGLQRERFPFIPQIFTKCVRVPRVQQLIRQTRFLLDGAERSWKDRQWERQIRTSKFGTGLRGLGCGVDWGPVSVRTAVKAVSVGELAYGK